jgi:hypothetical protein
MRQILLTMAGLATINAFAADSISGSQLTEAQLQNGGLAQRAASVNAQGGDIADVICALPEAYRKNYVIVFNSHSAQPTQPGSPRVLMFDPKASPEGMTSLISFTSHNTIEQAQFGTSSKDPWGRPIGAKFTHMNVGAGGSVNTNPTNCVGCHRNGQGMFQSVSVWKNNFGGNLASPNASEISSEMKSLEAFRKSLADPAKGKNYKCLVDLDKRLQCQYDTLKQAQEALRPFETVDSFGNTLYMDGMQTSCDERTIAFKKGTASPPESCKDESGRPANPLSVMNFDLSREVSARGNRDMFNCMKDSKADTYEAALLGTVACPGVKAECFLPDCSKITDPSRRSQCQTVKNQTPQVPDAPDLFNRSSTGMLNLRTTCDLQYDLKEVTRRSLTTYANYAAVAQATGAGDCLKKQMTQPMTLTPDGFRSTPVWYNLVKMQAGILKDSTDDVELREMAADLSKREPPPTSSKPGTPSIHGLDASECMKLAQISRAQLARKFGLSAETAQEAEAKNSCVTAQMEAADRQELDAKDRIVNRFSGGSQNRPAAEPSAVH